MFGGQLKLEEDGGVPIVVRQCIEQVDKRGNVPIFKVFIMNQTAKKHHVDCDRFGCCWYI